MYVLCDPRRLAAVARGWLPHRPGKRYTLGGVVGMTWCSRKVLYTTKIPLTATRFLPVSEHCVTWPPRIAYRLWWRRVYARAHALKGLRCHVQSRATCCRQITLGSPGRRPTSVVSSLLHERASILTS